MKRISRSGSLLIVLTLCASSGVGASQDHGHVVVLPDPVEWRPASPKLPPGAQIAVLSGDPSAPGGLYVFWAKLPDGYSVPPHWHPMDENVTVIKGVMILGFGARFEQAGMRELPAGSFVMLPKERPHFNRMKGETILQFHGVGPYDIVYVSAGQNPSPDAGAG